MSQRQGCCLPRRPCLSGHCSHSAVTRRGGCQCEDAWPPRSGDTAACAPALPWVCAVGKPPLESNWYPQCLDRDEGLAALCIRRGCARRMAFIRPLPLHWRWHPCRTKSAPPAVGPWRLLRAIGLCKFQLVYRLYSDTFCSTGEQGYLQCITNTAKLLCMSPYHREASYNPCRGGPAWR